MEEKNSIINSDPEENETGVRNGNVLVSEAETESGENTESESGTAADTEKNEDQAETQKISGKPEKKDRGMKWLFPVISAVLAAVLIAACVKLGSIERELESVRSEQSELKQDSSATAKELRNEKADNEDLRSRVSELTAQNESLASQNESLASKNDELENGAAAQLVKIKNAHEAGNWQETVDLYNALHQKYNGSAEDQQAKALADDAQAQLDAQKKQQEEEAAKGYETGITYEQLARTPDQYKGQKVKFSGKVIQVIEGSGEEIQIRLEVNDNYQTVLLGEYSSSIVSSRVLENDHITIYGTSVGTISYQSTLGGTITIPAVMIDKIDQ